MNPFKMAWRNVWRNRRRTLVTIGAMALALFALIQYSGLMRGYMAGMERNILDLETGDVQIFAPGYLDDPSLYTRIETPDELVSRLEQAGFAASARLRAGGLAAGGDTSAGAAFIGLDLVQDQRVSQIHQHVREGVWLDARDRNGVVIGRRLAKTLALGPGDELVLLSQGADGSMANELYTIRGVLKSIGDGIDRTAVFMTAEAFRELMVVPDGAHQLIVRKPEAMDLPAATAQIKTLAPKLDVRSWKDLFPTIASMLENSGGVMYVMFIIVYIAIGIVILNAMLMAVFERIKEFGVLKALGVSPGGVWRLIMLESAYETGLAVVVGALAAIPLSRYLATTGIHMESLGGASIAGIAWDPIWRAQIEPSVFSGPIFTLIFIVTLAVIYPALKAALIRPVQAIHHR